MRTVLLDTGPLVALLNARDSYHDWVQQKLYEHDFNSLIICESVLVETLYVTGHNAHSISAVEGLIRDGILIFDSILSIHPPDLFQLILRYNNVPASVTDAMLVSLYNKAPNPVIFTIDSDFHIYRDFKGNPLNLISPYT